MKVLITGTSQGIGLSIANKFLKEGHEVIGIDIKNSSIDNKNYTHIVKSITDNDLPTINDIDILINNAGVQNSKDDIDVNLKGTINVCEKYINNNIKSVLFMVSASASTGAEFPRYVASKGGILAYMRKVALDVSLFGATANSISPGGVRTSLNEHILNDEKLYKSVLNETLLNKWCDPEEIADLAYYLTVINKSITGEDILIDNGEKLKSNFIW